MIAYNNNNIRNPITKDVGRGLRMLLFYAIIHCLAAYVLHLVCMIFGTAIPQHFNENVFTLVLLVFMIVFGSNKSGAKSKSGSVFGAQTTEAGGGD